MSPKLELSIIFSSLFLKSIFPTDVKSLLSFCKIFAICCIVISASEVQIMSNPAAKKIEDRDLALTPPEKSNLFGKCFFINFANFSFLKFFKKF